MQIKLIKKLTEEIFNASIEGYCNINGYELTCGPIQLEFMAKDEAEGFECEIAPAFSLKLNKQYIKISKKGGLMYAIFPIMVEYGKDVTLDETILHYISMSSNGDLIKRLEEELSAEPSQPSEPAAEMPAAEEIPVPQEQPKETPQPQEDMKNYQILAMDETLCVVVESGAAMYDPYILKGGQLYDSCTFRPINPKPKQKMLTPDQQAAAKTLLSSAVDAWVSMDEQRKLRLQQQQAELERAAKASASAVPTAVPSTPQSTLDGLIAEAVAKISLGQVVDVAKPAIDQYIRETYGMLPKCVEVKSRLGEHKVKGLTAHEFETVLPLVEASIPVFLSGPAGCGKNVMCKQVAEALGLEFYFSNAVTQEYKITGFIDANGTYQKTQFYEAFTKGGVFMLDEMDASTPEVLVLLNAAIANGYFDFPTGRVQANENFRIVAAGNTYGTGADAEYTGRYQLDASSLDRFCVVDVTYDNDIEDALAGGDKELLKFVRSFRKAVKSASIKFTVSYRAIERLKIMSSMFDICKAVQLAILRGMEKEDAKLVSNNIGLTSNKYADALRTLVAA